RRDQGGELHSCKKNVATLMSIILSCGSSIKKNVWEAYLSIIKFEEKTMSESL
ncbi:hypothetical protein NPIL_480331, partial [Nephila pilipes]